MQYYSVRDARVQTFHLMSMLGPLESAHSRTSTSATAAAMKECFFRRWCPSKQKNEFIGSKMAKKKKKESGFIYWSPRVLSILFILFISMFALDVFDGTQFPLVLLALFMHLIPSFVLIAILVVAWKWEWVGGIAFILAGLLYIWSVVMKIITNGFELYYLSWILTIAGPAFLTGALWFLSWRKKK